MMITSTSFSIKSVIKVQTRGRKKCHFRGCTHTEKENPELHFFSVPVKKGDEERTSDFLKCMGLEDWILKPSSAKKELRVCQTHFRDEMFELNACKILLNKIALPVHYEVGQEYPAEVEQVSRVQNELALHEDGQKETFNFWQDSLFSLFSNESCNLRGGLKNLGRSCYVSAALQFIFSSYDVILSLKTHQPLCDERTRPPGTKNLQCLLCLLLDVYLELVKGPWSSTEKIFLYLEKYKDLDGDCRFKPDIDGDSGEIYQKLMEDIDICLTKLGLEKSSASRIVNTNNIFTCTKCQRQTLAKAEAVTEITVYPHESLPDALIALFAEEAVCKLQCRRCCASTNHTKKDVVEAFGSQLVILIKRY